MVTPLYTPRPDETDSYMYQSVGSTALKALAASAFPDIPSTLR